MSLRKQTVNGLFWTGLNQGGKQIIQFVITAILARLLSPHDFGLLGMATVFTGFLNIFADMGVSKALIQKQDATQDHLTSAFWLNIAIGFVTTLLLIWTAPWIADFYHMPELVSVLSVLSLNFILSSFTIVQQTVLAKRMEFRSLMIRSLVAQLVSGVVGVYMAYKGYGVWSLVGQTLVGSVINSILTWSISGWKPSFSFSVPAIKDIFSYSINMVAFNSTNYLFRNVDYLLIGKFLGTESLGIYTLAYKLMVYPLQNISWVVGKVLFSGFSKIQKDLEKFRRIYLEMITAISLITYAMMFFLCAIAADFVLAVYGPRWTPAIDLIRIFCFCGMFESIATTVGLIYQSQNKLKTQLNFSMFVSIPTTVLAVVLGLRYGIEGVALFYTVRTFFVAIISHGIANKIIDLPWKDFLAPLAKNFVIGGALFLFIMAAAPALKLVSVSPKWLLISKVFIGGAFFATVLLTRNEFQLRTKLMEKLGR